MVPELVDKVTGLFKKDKKDKKADDADAEAATEGEDLF